MKQLHRVFLLLVLFASRVDADAQQDTFGKTHFIVGYQPEQKLAVTEKKDLKKIAPTQHAGPLKATADGRITQAFFAPDDNVQQILIELIDHEKKAIKMAMFMLTDADVARALVRAQQRGVKVELVADKTGMEDRFGRIDILKEGKVAIFVYATTPSKKTWSNIMHNKFIVFAHNVLDKSLVWTGSLNLTKSARISNQENVVVLDDAHVVDRYTQQFERIKERCGKQLDYCMPLPSQKVARRNKSLRSRPSYKNFEVA